VIDYHCRLRLHNLLLYSLSHPWSGLADIAYAQVRNFMLGVFLMFPFWYDRAASGWLSWLHDIEYEFLTVFAIVVAISFLYIQHSESSLYWLNLIPLVLNTMLLCNITKDTYFHFICLSLKSKSTTIVIAAPLRVWLLIPGVTPTVGIFVEMPHNLPINCAYHRWCTRAAFCSPCDFTVDTFRLQQGQPCLIWLYEKIDPALSVK